MEKVTSRDGTTIGYKRIGSGRPLLLIHGTTADHRRWDAISSRLEEHFTVFAVDRRGRGSSGDSPNYALMREAEDTAAVIEVIGEPAFVLGHSYGAVVGLEAAVLTDQIARLILYEPDLPSDETAFPPGVTERMQAKLDQGELEAALEVFFREVVRMPEPELAVYRQLPMWKGRIELAPTIPRELRAGETYHFDDKKFTGLKIPTMLMVGGDSPAHFLKAAEMIASALPNSRIAILPGQRHIAMDTNPDLFLKEVLDFLLA